MSNWNGRAGRGAMRKVRADRRQEAYDRQVKYWAEHGEAALDPEEMLPLKDRIEVDG